MRIKIVKCSDKEYWYNKRIDAIKTVLWELRPEDFGNFDLSKDDKIGDYVVWYDDIYGDLLSVRKEDAIIIDDKTETTSNEPVNNFKEEVIPIIDHPNYYNKGKIEVIDFIEDQELGFNLGNAVKYITRAGKKNEETYIQDLKKAIWYLEREVNK